MEIPEISMISDFEAGVNCLQDPSIVSRFLTIQVYRFWQWGAVILAILATFSSIIKRVKLFLIRLRTVTPSAEPLLQLFSEDFDFTDDDDDCEFDVDDCSSVSSLEDDDDEEVDKGNDDVTTSFEGDENYGVAGGDFQRWQNGNLTLRRRNSGGGQRFSWSDFSTGKSVVKLWDSLGLGFDYEDSCKNIVSMWDFNENQKLSDFFGGCLGSAAVAGLESPSRDVVLSAEVNGDRNGIVLGAYDKRMKQNAPVVCAKWGSDLAAVAGKVVNINADGVKKVYVRDDVNGVFTVGDLRNLKTPLNTATKSNVVN